jgi:hypothetical protein
MNDLLRTKIEKAWALVNLIAFSALLIWGLLQDKATLKSHVSGLPAFCCAALFFSMGGYFIFSGRIFLRSERYLIKSESPISFWLIVTMNFLIGFRLLILY